MKHQEKRDIMLSFVKSIVKDLSECARMIDEIVAKGNL